MERKHTVPEELLDKIRQNPSRRGATEWAWRANLRYGEESLNNRRAI